MASASSSSVPRKHVAGGYCLEREGSGISNSFCALEAGQCDLEEQLFRSAREAEFAGFFRSCVFQSAVREDVFVGHCDLGEEDASSEASEVCAVDEASCASGGRTFVPVSVGNTRGDCSIERAIFGTCDGECVWSIDGCENGDYRLPTGNKNCTCDQVRVGGCKTPGAPILCAVGPDACDGTQNYRTPDEVVTEEGWECYLCRPPTSPKPVAPPTVAPATALLSSEDANGNSSSSLLVGATVAGVVGGLLILGLVLFVFFRSRRKLPTATETAPAAMVDTKRGREIDVSEIEDVEEDDETPGDAAAAAAEPVQA